MTDATPATRPDDAVALEALELRRRRSLARIPAPELHDDPQYAAAEANLTRLRGQLAEVEQQLESEQVLRGSSEPARVPRRSASPAATRTKWK